MIEWESAVDRLMKQNKDLKQIARKELEKESKSQTDDTLDN